MLTVAENSLSELAKKAGREVSIHLYGLEINSETCAICRADMLLKGDGSQAENIAFGSTLSNDEHNGETFDFILSNPPYDKDWKKDAGAMGVGREKQEKHI